ncbi:hypothetical protein [Rhodoferax sp. WC2427]|uniref:hypothetical protein n=1 Tax=Rhodoferax sp. WC2427 TaxID=3234144 RepID=UPI0034652D85
MNFEPFDPFERSEPLPPPPLADKPSAHYFDRAGCVWIVACVLLAGSAGRLLPALAEPGGLHHALVVLGLAQEPADGGKAPTTVASLPAQDAKPSQPIRDVLFKQEIGPLVPAILRQF